MSITRHSVALMLTGLSHIELCEHKQYRGNINDKSRGILFRISAPNHFVMIFLPVFNGQWLPNLVITVVF